MLQYRCIYCGKGIPADTGLSCAACSAKGSSYKNYDKELQYADDIEPSVAKILENTEKHEFRQAGQQAREELARLYEENVEVRKAHRFDRQEELQVKREGKILHMSEFLRLYRASLPEGWSAWFTDKGGMANTLGLFVGHPGLLSPCSHKAGEPHYIGFVQVPMMQEFEELHFDHYNVPLGSKRRGWRTILLRSVEQKILTEQAAHENFGAPPSNAITRRYLQQMQFFRTR